MGDFYGNDVGGGDGCDGHQVVDEVADMEVDKVVDMVLKIPDEGFADVSLKFDNTIVKEIMIEVVNGDVDMEVDKVADSVK